MNENLDLLVSVDEVRRNLHYQYEGVEASKATARSFLSAASLIVALISILRLNDPELSEKASAIFLLGIATIIILYIALIILCVKVVLPVKMNAPIASQWEEFDEHFFGKEPRDVLAEQLNAYINAHTLNEGIVSQQSRGTKIAGYLLGGIVIMLFLLTALAAMSV